MKVVHKPTNALFINLDKVSNLQFKYTTAPSAANQSYIYAKTLSEITSFYILGDVAARRRAACCHIS